MPKTCPTCGGGFKAGPNQKYCKAACFPKCQTCGGDGYYATGYCRMHYRRFIETGDPGEVGTRRPARSDTCAARGCERKPHGRGFCTGHLYRIDNGLPLDEPLRQYEYDGACRVKGCGKKRHKSADFCARHNSRVRRHGEPGAANRQRAAVGDATWNDPEVMRAKKLLENYNMTTDEYDRMYAAQSGRCASCRKDSAEAKSRMRSKRWMHVDHDHACCPGPRSCGKCVRGLLCHGCNRGSGFFGDDPDALERHAAYLRETARFPALAP